MLRERKVIHGGDYIILLVQDGNTNKESRPQKAKTQNFVCLVRKKSSDGDWSCTREEVLPKGFVRRKSAERAMEVLQRAVETCRSSGLDIQGLSAADILKYGGGVITKM